MYLKFAFMSFKFKVFINKKEVNKGFNSNLDNCVNKLLIVYFYFMAKIQNIHKMISL